MRSDSGDSPESARLAVESLDQIETAEAFLRSLGLRQPRVSRHADVARIELAASDIAILMKDGRRQAVADRLKQLGFAYVTLDLAAGSC